MINYSGTYTDQYQLKMAQGYFLRGRKENIAVFDYFFRKLPFHGGYAIFAGLGTLLDILENLHFNETDLEFLKKHGYDGDFLKYLGDFRFSGSVFSSEEGDVIFPVRPVLRVEANIIEAQIIETVLLNTLNFQTLIATKASRIKRVAGSKMLIDFGLRRAQGAGGYHASRAAIIGGFDATSNVQAGIDFDIPLAGTMAHSYIQSYDDELTAFRDFAGSNPDNCILLVDTYDTLRSGVPNAIITGLEMAREGKELKGIRLDSGDLAYLSGESRKMLDAAGLKNVQIALSNQLDEYVIRSLVEQNACVDSFGVGTSLSAALPDAALDGVYKLAWYDGKPRIKLSESISKITLPHRKQVYRVRNPHGRLMGADVITLEEEVNPVRMHHPSDPGKSMVIKDYHLESLLHKVMEKGKRLFPVQNVQEIRKFSQERLTEIPSEYKRFENPHVYKIGISDGLKKELERMITEVKK